MSNERLSPNVPQAGAIEEKRRPRALSGAPRRVGIQDSAVVPQLHVQEEDGGSATNSSDSEHEPLLSTRRGSINGSSSLLGRMLRCFRPKSKKQTRMSPKDSLTLSWWMKWKKYRRFPFKFVLHLAITALVTALVFLDVNDLTAYSVANYATFYQIFYPSSFSPTYGLSEPSDTLHFYDIPSVVKAANKSVQSFYHFPTVSTDIFRFYDDMDMTRPPPYVEMAMVVYKQDPQNVFNPATWDPDTSTESLTYNLTASDLGPLATADTEEQQRFFRSLVSFTLTFRYYNVHLRAGHPTQHVWTIQELFDFTARGGRCDVNLFISTSTLAPGVPMYVYLASARVPIAIILVLLNIVSAISSLRSLGRSFTIYQETKKKLRLLPMRASMVSETGSVNSSVVHPSQFLLWADLPLSVKLRFFSIWFIISLLSNICLTIACFFDLFVNMGPESMIGAFTKVSLGVGCMLSWVNLIRYLEFDSKYMVLVRALGQGLPTVARFLVSAFPIFIGYALFGLLVFSQDSPRFSSLDQSALTLFGLQNGDDIQATIRSTASHPVVARIYFYTFLFISIYAITNIFISIMEDAFFTVKEMKEAATARATNEHGHASSTDLNDSEQLWELLMRIHRQKDAAEGGAGGGDDFDDDEESAPSVRASVRDSLLPVTRDMRTSASHGHIEDEEETPRAHAAGTVDSALLRSLVEDMQQEFEEQQKVMQRRLEERLQAVLAQHQPAYFPSITASLSFGRPLGSHTTRAAVISLRGQPPPPPPSVSAPSSSTDATTSANATATTTTTASSDSAQHPQAPHPPP